MVCDRSNFKDLSFYWWELTSEIWSVRGVILTWQELFCERSNFEDLSFYWWELISGIWNVRGLILTWQELICDRTNFEDLSFYWWELTSGVCTRWGVSKFFNVRGVVLNLTMIVFVDLPLYGRELVGDFGGK